mgnify:CR=1 FL=1
MQTTTLSFANLHNHGELFANIFRARKQSFIVQKRWNLPQTDDMEFDQYDTPMSRWVAIHENGRVLAGVRLTPTTARWRWIGMATDTTNCPWLSTRTKSAGAPCSAEATSG